MAQRLDETHSPRFTRFHLLLAVVSTVVIAVFFFFPPITVLDKAHAIGYGICHQLPASTFHYAGIPLPLCARCTGIYLGAVMGVVGIVLLGRGRSVELPPTHILVVLLGFIGVMGFDGINSFLSAIPRAPHLYEPQDWLRLTTGTLHGLAMAAIVFPIFNRSLWHADRIKIEPVIGDLKALGLFLMGAMVIILLVLWQHPLLLYPLTIISTVGVMMMLGFINTVFVLVLVRREENAQTWGDVAIPAAMGLAVSFLMISGLGALRTVLMAMTELAAL